VQKFIVVEHAGSRAAHRIRRTAVRRGPRGAPDGLRPGGTGIPTNRTVETNEYLQTIYPNIYAAGDVAGPFQFTHTAAHQAWYRGGQRAVWRRQKFKATTR
jgi:pyruvate/2-oxoglutarate dehydrogenase complex dihydrolipoamide dehydrogenase (E3) component